MGETSGKRSDEFFLILERIILWFYHILSNAHPGQAVRFQAQICLKFYFSTDKHTTRSYNYPVTSASLLLVGVVQKDRCDDTYHFILSVHSENGQ